MCVTPLSTFSIPVMPHGLLRIPDNMELRNIEKRGVARLAFNDVGITGFVGDVDTGHTRNIARNGVVCAGHLWGSL